MTPGQLLLTGNLKQTNFDGLGIQNTFTKEIIKILPHLNYEAWENLTHFKNSLIWYNSFIKITCETVNPFFLRALRERNHASRSVL